MEAFLVGIKSETDENHFRFPLVLFSFLGVLISSTDNKATTAETATSAEVTTQAPSTAMPTTVPATTEQVTTSSSYNNVVPVVGYGYSYGKKLLEQAGFTVEISDYLMTAEPVLQELLFLSESVRLR